MLNLLQLWSIAVSGWEKFDTPSTSRGTATCASRLPTTTTQRGRVADPARALADQHSINATAKGPPPASRR